MPDLKTALVTGAAGFVGAAVVRALLERGYGVHVLLRNTTKIWRLAGFLDSLVVHRGDLTNPGRVREVVADVRPGVIFHLAAYGGCEAQADARQIFSTNVLGTYNLLEAGLEAGTALFVNTGSSSEYGFRSEAMKESDRLEPNSYYAVAKAAQGHLCTLLARRTPMAIPVLRLFSVYGPWEEPGRLVPTVLQRTLQGLPLDMVGRRVARDFVYIDDVVEALTDVDGLLKVGREVINLGTGTQTTLEQFVGAVREVTGMSSPVRWGGMQARQWDTTSWVADPAKAEQLLNWTASHTLVQGLAKTLAWLKNVGYGQQRLMARMLTRMKKVGHGHDSNGKRIPV